MIYVSITPPVFKNRRTGGQGTEDGKTGDFPHSLCDGEDALTRILRKNYYSDILEINK